MQSYRELVVWQKSMMLVKSVYILVRKLPKEEIYALSDQMRRAVISVPSNIAEGYARESSRDYVHFLSIAKGSLYELDTQIQVSIMLGFFNEEQANEALSLCDECARMLTSMIRKITI